LADTQASLTSIDNTMRLFDPEAKPATIKPRVKRQHPNRFRAGEFSRAIMAVLRQADKPLTIREIAERVGPACGLDMSTTKAAHHVVASVRAALARPHDGVKCEKNGKESMVWRVT
jgi:hypothetical protein